MYNPNSRDFEGGSPAPARTRSTSRRGRTLGLVAGVAALARAAAVYNYRRARQAEFDSPPKGRFVEVDGVALHFTDTGAGPAIVLIHGNSVTLGDWAASGVAERLARQYRVLAFDRPGFGYSGRPRDRVFTSREQARLILGALKDIGVENPVVVGHSFGAQVALQMGIEGGGAIGGLVLAGGYYFPNIRVDSLMSLPSAVPVLGDVLDHVVQPFLTRALFSRAARKMFARAEVHARFALWPHAMAARPGQILATAEDGVLMVPGGIGLAEAASRQTLRAIVIAGARDKIVDTVAQSERLAGEIGAELRIVPGAGHMVHYADPDLVADAAASLAAPA